MDHLKVRLPGFAFSDLFDPAKLKDLADLFYADVRSTDGALMERFDRYAAGEIADDVEISGILVAMGPHLSRFLARAFGVEEEWGAWKIRADRDKVIFRFKKEFFIRRALKRIDRARAATFDIALLEERAAAARAVLSGGVKDDLELATASAVVALLDHERYLKVPLPAPSKEFLLRLRRLLTREPALKPLVPKATGEGALKELLSSLLNVFEEWTVAAYYRRDEATRRWGTFRVPQPFDHVHLVETELSQDPVPGLHTGPEGRQRHRNGFDLTDERFTLREVMSEADYCIFCHERNKDSCSKGLKDGESFRKNPLGFTLKGCPLDQKISESQLLMAEGDPLAALSLIMIDNPMVPGTGHRICNDCMKACIFQKQDPVNIPQIETRILTDVLGLPWGFEIYSLLTRWNPLNIQRPYMLPYNGLKILIVGLGPAGYTLAHYFLNEGFGVVGVDGLKIEPLPPELAGDGATPFEPVKDVSTIWRKLGERVLAGFGGVSEYGITVRWDKNFLTVLYLNLIRRERFRIYDGVRFGGTLTVHDAWDYGFDHVCIAAGAGKPAFVAMKNNLIRGIRKASDFLMALQLTGAAKRDSMANLQVELPAIVIGGGLTAIDTATELMAYYPVQVSKIKRRYDALCARYGKESIDAMFDPEEKEKLGRFLGHAEALETERARASQAGGLPDFARLIRAWGGVRIFYRKSIRDSPAYRLNHEEIIKSLEEGIAFVEQMNPVEAVPDESGAVGEMVFDEQENAGGTWRSTGRRHRVPARTVIVAAGTAPNVMYEREHKGTFALDARDEYFRVFRLEGDQLVPGDGSAPSFFTSYDEEGKHVTFFGDNHPEFAGNVVKAMASAKLGVQAVIRSLGDRMAAARRAQGEALEAGWGSLCSRLDGDLRPRVETVVRLTPTITEVIVHAPKAARQFRPGQFYRLQNYEVDAERIEDTLLTMEGIALTGAWVDDEKGLIGLITLEVGASSRLCAFLKPGQRVVVMGPTGCPTEIEEGSTVLLLGGGLGNAVLFSIAKAFKERNGTVLYFAGYRKKEDLFKQEEIEAFTDVVVYSVDAGDPIVPRRPQDRTFVGNIVESLLAYGRGTLGGTPVPLQAAARVIAIGSDRMMAAVAEARHGVLKPYLKEHHAAIASINSPMQCMMKAVCAQCLQRHVDPESGREEFVFSCVQQDQPMDQVDFSNLRSRLKGNSVMEKIADRWLAFLVDKHGLEHV